MSITRFFSLYFVTAIALWVFNQRFGFPIQFLRAESGLVLQQAYSPNWWEWIKPCLTSAYGGHFIPAALSTELLASWMFGPNEALWSVRQALVLAAMSVCAACAMQRSILNVHPAAGKRASLIIGVAIALSFAVHPFATELFSWPITWFQMACLACVALALYWLMEFINEPTRRSAFLCTLSAYASMHFFGIGLAVSVAGLISLALSAYSMGAFAKARSALVVGASLTLLHATPTAQSGGGRDGPVQISASVSRFLTLIVEQPIAAIRATFSTPWLSVPDLQSQTLQTISGAAGLVVIAMMLAKLWTSAASGEGRRIALASAITFPLLAYLGTCLLTVARIRAETDHAALSPFLVGGRYLIFPMFFGMLTLSVAFRPNRFNAAISLVVLAWFVTSSAFFVRDVAPSLWPDRLLSNQEIWSQLEKDPTRNIDLKRYREFTGGSCVYSNITGGPPCDAPSGDNEAKLYCGPIRPSIPGNKEL
ncbi:hypothetical protein [Agrobacterium sp. El2ro-1b]|uniref:hypothetical protein n=1 Tax=Agrobacterium sp. El2ro-1b TaxID=2969528 RepID=UPI003AAC8E35